ncbi:MAG: type II toxin-antitoxin system VapC family toxin [Granulosicoccus sp.]
MIAVDTNVLLRYLLDDDPAQSPVAARLIKENNAVLVSDVVLVETIWTLTGKKYRAKPADIAQTLYSLFQEATLFFEHAQTVWSALQLYEAALNDEGKTPDFPDVLILCSARQVAVDNGDELKCVYTFDKVAQQLAGMEMPA